jgi:putative membrane protein
VVTAPTPAPAEPGRLVVADDHPLIVEQTVKFHLAKAYRKLGVDDRTEARRSVLDHGLLGSPSTTAASLNHPPGVKRGWTPARTVRCPGAVAPFRTAPVPRESPAMVRSLLISWAVMAAAFAVTASLVSGFDVDGGFFTYLWIALLFGVVNAIVGTILRIITLPLTVITLGLFSIVVNALLLELTDAISSDLTIDSFFWSAIWAAIILAVVSVCLHLLVSVVLKPGQAT